MADNNPNIRPAITPGAAISDMDANRLNLLIYVNPEESQAISQGVLPDSFKNKVASAQQQIVNTYLSMHPEGAPQLDTVTPDSELKAKAEPLSAKWFAEHPDFAQQYKIESNVVTQKYNILYNQQANAKSVELQKSNAVMMYDKMGNRKEMQAAGIAAGNAKKQYEQFEVLKQSLKNEWNNRELLWFRCVISDYPVGPDGLFDPEVVCAAALEASAAPAKDQPDTYVDAQGNRIAVGATVEETDKKCPSCGATVVYDPDTLSMVCPFCGYSKELPKPEAGKQSVEEIDFTTATQRANLNWGEVRKSLTCKNCGATTVFDANDTAACCPYCGSTQVMPVDDMEDAMAPGGVVPFEVSQQKASELFRSWIKGKFFAPNAAKKSCEAKNFNGVYLPFWTYDTQTVSPYTVKLGYRHQRTNSKGETETYYEYKHFSGTYRKFVDDEVVYASKRTDNPYINAVKTFDFGRLRPYSPEFIAGFMAERYTVGLDDGWQVAKNQIKNTLRNEIGEYEKKVEKADTVSGVTFDTNFSKVTFKYVLAPIWISNYKFNDKVFNFVVNGQTGKIAGKSPVSVPKVIATIAAIIAAIVIIYLLFNR